MVEGSSWTETKKECETNKPKISTGWNAQQKLEVVERRLENKEPGEVSLKYFQP